MSSLIAQGKKKTSKSKKRKSPAAARKRQRAKLNSKITKANPIARWGIFEFWRVTVDEIHLFDSIEMSREWVAKQTKGSGKKKKTIKAHEGPVEFTIRFELHKELFQKIDIAKKIRRWNSLVGKSAPFYVGTTALGAACKYQLVNVRISDVQQVRGIIVACTIELSFSMLKSKAANSEKKQFKKAIAKKSKKGKKKYRQRRTG